MSYPTFSIPSGYYMNQPIKSHQTLLMYPQQTLTYPQLIYPQSPLIYPQQTLTYPYQQSNNSELYPQYQSTTKTNESGDQLVTVSVNGKPNSPSKENKNKTERNILSEVQNLSFSEEIKSYANLVFHRLGCPVKRAKRRQ